MQFIKDWTVLKELKGKDYLKTGIGTLCNKM